MDNWLWIFSVSLFLTIGLLSAWLFTLRYAWENLAAAINEILTIQGRWFRQGYSHELYKDKVRKRRLDILDREELSCNEKTQ